MDVARRVGFELPKTNNDDEGKTWQISISAYTSNTYTKLDYSNGKDKLDI